jgi:ABC-type branched-subunit amino acid transport system ATPase component
MILRFSRQLAAAAILSALLLMPAGAQEETIKVGVLHSLSGTMAMADQVAIMDRGQIAFAGDAASLDEPDVRRRLML